MVVESTIVAHQSRSKVEGNCRDGQVEIRFDEAASKGFSLDLTKPASGGVVEPFESHRSGQVLDPRLVISPPG